MVRKMSSECPGFRVRQASRVLARIYDDALRPTGLQASQLPVLAALAMFGEPGATMSALAQAVVMDRTTLSRNIRPLEVAGFARVARSPHDARVRVVLITRAGERALEAAFPLWEEAFGRIREALGPDAIRNLQSLLSNVVALATTEAPEEGDGAEERPIRRGRRG
jgi:DNA-binding MarR family transcriptional regulator